MGLSWLQSMYSFLVIGDVECIIETGTGNRIVIVIKLCITIAVFC